MFTNSMVETLENSDAGDTFRVALDYKFRDYLVARISFLDYERDVAVDTTETDIDRRTSSRGFSKGCPFACGWVLLIRVRTAPSSSN
jgi:hypothetical protein